MTRPLRPLAWLGITLVLLTPLSMAGEVRQVLRGQQLRDASTSHQLIVTGTNQSSAQQVLVIRIDDSHAPSYANRVNLERVVPPGPFRVSTSLGGLVKPTGQPLQIERLRQLIVFAGHPNSGIELSNVQIKPRPRLPEGTYGWDLGPKESALWPGFEPLDIHFSGLAGRNLRAIDRGARQPASEALTRDGIRGIESLQLPLEPGRWHITLWIDDRGEWEYLPHPLVRSIDANQQPVLQQKLSPQQWIAKRYLAGLDREYRTDDDVWKLYGERPDGRLSFDVDVAGDGLNLRFSGHMPEAGFLAAVLAERSSAFTVRNQVEHDRQRWWQTNWRITPSNVATTTSFRLEAGDEETVIGRGTSGSLDFTFFAPKDSEPASLILKPPIQVGAELASTLRWGRWQLRRTRLSSTLLEPVDDHLRTSTLLPASNGLPRRIHLQVDVPATALAGQYHGELQVIAGSQQLRQPFTVVVPAADLPVVDRPIGIYLERPPHLNWFDETRNQTLAALRCDLNYLRSIGLTGVSPGFTTPQSGHDIQRFVDELSTVAQAGFVTPYLAYAPFKRLQSNTGNQGAVERIKQVEQQLTALNLPRPIWSIADEPSNPGNADSLAATARYFEAYAPLARLAGHLNHRGDSQFLRYLDMALINDGYGVDQADIDSVRRAGVSPWFYNMEHKRAAAGFYLWRTGADGYLQWHGRMPTAAPFDPTDGREDDVQFLYPSNQICPVSSDVDRSLFELAEGVNDLRWLRWLEYQARDSNDAANYLAYLQETVPTRWSAMRNISVDTLNRWRAGITALAHVLP